MAAAILLEEELAFARRYGGKPPAPPPRPQPQAAVYHAGRGQYVPQKVRHAPLGVAACSAASLLLHVCTQRLDVAYLDLSSQGLRRSALGLGSACACACSVPAFADTFLCLRGSVMQYS
eukprot:6205167-Pleurochrysis_carterae.AAC.4